MPERCECIDWPKREVTTYRHPRTWGVRFAVGGLAAATALTVLLIAAIADGQVLATLFFAILAIALVVPEGWIISHVAREIELSDSEIQSKPFLGRSVALRWSDVESAERFLVFTFDRTRPDVYRLISRDRGSLAFTSKIGGFEELVEVIRSRTPVLEELAEPPWWRKLIYRGFP